MIRIALFDVSKKAIYIVECQGVISYINGDITVLVKKWLCDK